MPIWLLIILFIFGMSLVASMAVSASAAMAPGADPAARAAEIVLAPRPAGDESSLRSPGSDVATSVRFENRTTRALDVHWLDFAGQRKRYATVEPGSTYSNATYVGHVWLVAESSGEGLAIYVADTAPGVAIVT
jgi:hypothetical protein